jgi:hypothetical protein
MNAKLSKKLRKEARKEVRSIERDIEQKTFQEFFNNTLKPKPRYVPLKLWIWGAKIFLNL